MYLLFVFCLVEGMYCDTKGITVSTGVRVASVDNNTDRESCPPCNCPALPIEESNKCRTNFEATSQMVFYSNGREWKTDKATLKDGYLITRGVGAHKLHTTTKNWNTARKLCRDDGGDLAVLNSIEEEGVLLDLLKRHGENEAWVGAHDIFEEGDWVTITGESLEKAGFSKWSTRYPNQPDNYNGAENCGILTSEGGINDVRCTERHPVLCEIDIY